MATDDQAVFAVPFDAMIHRYQCGDAWYWTCMLAMQWRPENPDCCSGTLAESHEQVVRDATEHLARCHDIHQIAESAEHEGWSRV